MGSKEKKKVFGVGINDLQDGVCDKGGKLKASYRYWYNMLARCYNDKTKVNSPHCAGCSVCDSWMRYSNFLKWFNEHYVEGWHLDKDILVKGNKVYSPETCCFVPQEINSLFTKHERGRGAWPIGVYYNARGWQRKFVAALHIDGVRRSVGSFLTPEEAFGAYKNAKEQQIKRVADNYKDVLESRVYLAMYNYTVEITD